jgi:integrase
MTATELVPNYLDVTKLALSSFLARYREPTLTAYKLDLRTFIAWCQKMNVEVLRATRGELESYLRHLEGCNYAPATIARRFGTVATFYRYAVIDNVIPVNPAVAVSRPKVEWEGQRRTVLHPLEFAAVLSAARTSGANDHALVCLLGMIGLRVSEACALNVTDIRYESGYELIRVIGKGSKPADIPLPIPVLRAVHDAIDGRHVGPLLRTRSGRRNGSRWSEPSSGPGRSRRRCDPTYQPARTSSHLLHHWSHHRGRDPRHAIRHAPRGPTHHPALRHGQIEPRPPRRPLDRCLPSRHEHWLNRPEPAICG